MWDDFKKFALRGNVLDLAVAVIIGGAFGRIVSSLVGDVIMPIVGVVIGGISLIGLQFTYGEAVIKYGAFLQSIVDFLVIAMSIFLFVRLISGRKKAEAPPAKPEPSKEVFLLTEIRDLLKKRGA